MGLIWCRDELEEQSSGAGRSGAERWQVGTSWSPADGASGHTRPGTLPATQGQSPATQEWLTLPPAHALQVGLVGPFSQLLQGHWQSTTACLTHNVLFRQVYGLRMMNAVQPKTPDAVLQVKSHLSCAPPPQALQQHGAAVGGKKMVQWEFRHAREAVASGTYVTLWNDYRKHECTR